MKSKLFKKYFLTTSLIILFSVTFMLLILSVAVTNYLAVDKYRLLEDNCTSVSKIAVSDANSPSFERNVYNVAQVLSSVSDVEIYVTDTKGKILVCTCNTWATEGHCEHTMTGVPKEIFSKILSEGYKQTGNLGGFFNEVYYIVGKPITAPDGTAIGTVISASTAKSLKELFKVFFQLFLVSTLIPIIFMFFAVYAMIYRWYKPLKMMSSAARSMAKGDFSKRIPIMSDDEIGELSSAFNQMTDSLTQLEGMRRSFIANVSHELKTPMTTIGGFIDGIIDGTIEKEKQVYYLEIVSNEVKRLSRLVQSMLSLSKLESGENKINPSEFDAYDVLCNIVISFEQQINDKNIDIIGLGDLLPITVVADKDLIYQVFYNLIDNAIKFTNVGGAIKFTLKEKDTSLIFSIENTGEGINPEDLPHIFERFYKTDRSRSVRKDSTGLGLYLAKTIVNLHNGDIIARSIQNKSTLFTLAIPKKYSTNQGEL
ncbi:MAG: HAMP domain-containing histidine kinase [Ruminococcaceae bacterium]|nr:HAMP domain-containing histidine kinase [Oscillospiraceae bacterium]